MRAKRPITASAMRLMNCGDERLSRPAWLWLTYGMGPRTPNLPGYIAMCPACRSPTSPTGGRRPTGVYQGTYMDGGRTGRGPDREHPRPAVTRADRAGDLDLLADLDRRHRGRSRGRVLKARIATLRASLSGCGWSRTDAFDVARMSRGSVRDGYGPACQPVRFLIARAWSSGRPVRSALPRRRPPSDAHDHIAEHHRRLGRPVRPGDRRPS